ncbi:MAG TPA: Calx-beta domain-containing protein [Thermoanaerobaculia bacterium]|nr:Calx-beta domain-containing protein [Thermoanaerobaculia bacterium]
MPRRSLSSLSGAALVVSLIACAGAPARGILFAPIDDLELALGAELVVDAVVGSELPASEDRWVTEYELEVLRVLVGAHDASRLVIASPGRLLDDGSGLDVPGAPRFAAGERAILFLGPADAEGRRPIHHLLLGAFHRVETPEGAFAVRDLAGGTEIGDGGVRSPNAAGTTSASEAIREYEGFTTWLAELGAGRVRAGDYLSTAPTTPEGAGRLRVASAYTFFVDPPARWFQFDSGASVPLRSGAAGQAGVDGDVEHGWVHTATGVWSADPGSNIRLTYGGTSGASGGLQRRDSTNTVLWNDPNGEISGTFTCGGGGVLGLGGGWYSGSHTFRNGDGVLTSGRALVEADVVINDGAGCYLTRHGGSDGEEVVAHEIGHAIGLGHSSVSSALMRGTAHGDGRGASLRPDDRAGIRYLYPDFSSDGGDPGVVRFRAESYTGSEGGSVTVVVQRTGGSSGAASVSYSMVSATAVAGADYVSSSGTLSWSADQDGNRQITVQLLQDQLVEGSESFEVRLSQASGASLGTPDRTRVTIEDDDAPAPAESVLAFQQTTFTVDETAGGLEVPVSRSGSLAGGAAVDVAVTGGSAQVGPDFAGVPVRLSWGAGEGGVRVARITMVDDALVEGDETIELALRNPSPGASVGGAGRATVTVLDDDARADGPGSLRFARATFSGLEGSGLLEVRVERVGGTRGAVSARVSTTEASARDGVDFRGGVETVSWGDGQGGVRTVRFALYADGLVEGAESFGVTLEAPTGGAALAQPRVATAIVRDDDFRIEQEVRLPGARGQTPRIAYRPDGSSAVAWSGPDGAGDGVFVQLYDATGRSDGASFRLHGSAAGDQRLPAVAFDAAGRMVTAWVEEGGNAFTTGDGQVVVASSVGTRLLARVWNGAQPASPPFELATSGGDLGSLGVASDGQGRHWVVWKDGGRVRVRRFDERGALGPAIEVGAGEQAALDVAVTGEAAVAWRDRDAIRLRRLDAVGLTLSTVTVAEGGALDGPDVAVRADGGAVVVWTRLGSSEDVLHRRYDRAGHALGPAERTHGSPAGAQRRARVRVNAIGDFAVAWEDGASGEVRLRVFDAAGVAQGAELAVGVGSGSSTAQAPAVAIGEHDAVTVAYERRSLGGDRAGVALRRVRAQVLDDGCDSASDSLCTHRSRFAVTALWRDAAGHEGTGRGNALSTDTGYFWFFDAGNVELVVKALDGCGVNDRFWVFAGGLTDLEVLLLVDDLESGHSRAYYNPLGRAFVPIRDAGAFSSCDVALGVHGAQAPAREALGSGSGDLLPSSREPLRIADPAAACRPAPDALCLGADQRFQVDAEWSAAVSAGVGLPVALTPDTGYFWFFGPDNVELVVKVLDACALNDKYWVFAGGLTDVGVKLRVIDKASGRRRIYQSAPGQAFQPVRDVLAFPCR